MKEGYGTGENNKRPALNDQNHCAIVMNNMKAIAALLALSVVAVHVSSSHLSPHFFGRFEVRDYDLKMTGWRGQGIRGVES